MKQQEYDHDADDALAQRFHQANVRTWAGVLRYWLLAPPAVVTLWFLFDWLFPAPSWFAVVVLVWLLVVSVATGIYGVVVVICKADPD